MDWLRKLLAEKVGGENFPSASRVVVLLVTAFSLGAGTAAITASFLADVITTSIVLDYFVKLFMASAGAYVGGQIGKGLKRG